MTDALDAETKDETEEPVDLIPTLIPLPPDEVCVCLLLYDKFFACNTCQCCYHIQAVFHLIAF